MRFRPCIDLRQGKVVQIVGGTIQEKSGEEPVTNFQSDKSSCHYAELYREHGLTGGHVISLGPGNEAAALSALQSYPGGLHMGGGVTPENALGYLEAGASHVIVTSYVFSGGKIDQDRLSRLVDVVGRHRLVLDLSCRKRDGAYWIVTDRWQNFTDVKVEPETLKSLAVHCDEFLVHGVDVEGKMQGIESTLVRLLGAYSPLPVTYAGGVKSLEDMELIRELGNDKVDATIGSALDIFGGAVPFVDVISWHRNASSPV